VAGNSLTLVDPVAGITAACHGADANDPRHEWQHIKGRRHVCRRCQARRLVGLPHHRVKRGR
jgi:hypothetical protein